MNRDDLMRMPINDLLSLFESKEAEIRQLNRLIEKLGRKCNKYKKKLTVLHFGGEENIPRNDKDHSKNTNRTLAGSDFYGFYAFLRNEELHIGKIRTGILYCGEYKGSDTPYLADIKKENLRLYNSIVKHFGYA